VFKRNAQSAVQLSFSPTEILPKKSFQENLLPVIDVDTLWAM